jgi:hypothetical protein
MKTAQQLRCKTCAAQSYLLSDGKSSTPEGFEDFSFSASQRKAKK